MIGNPLSIALGTKLKVKNTKSNDLNDCIFEVGGKEYTGLCYILFVKPDISESKKNKWNKNKDKPLKVDNESFKLRCTNSGTFYFELPLGTCDTSVDIFDVLDEDTYKALKENE